MTATNYPGRVYPGTPETKRRAWYRKPLVWVGIIVGVLALGCLGAMLNPSSPPPVQPISVPEASASNDAVAESTPAEAPAAPTPVTVAGNGDSVVDIGAILNGGFRVDYSFGYWCGIAEFLKADGSGGAGFMEMVNDCTGDLNSNLSGSTVVNLTDVTMIKASNTEGDWSLTFTPLV